MCHPQSIPKHQQHPKFLCLSLPCGKRSLAHRQRNDCLQEDAKMSCFQMAVSGVLWFTYFLKDFIYLFMRDTERESQRHRQREKQAPCREPNVGLNPRSPGSGPGLKVALNCWATRAALSACFKYYIASLSTRAALDYYFKEFRTLSCRFGIVKFKCQL